jgi:hypothetical protein
MRKNKENRSRRKSLLISREDAKHVLSRVEGAALCHFDRREKSFSDPWCAGAERKVAQ